MHKTFSVYSLTIFLLTQLVNTAEADSPTPYMGAQLGYADLHQGEFVKRHLDRITRKFGSQELVSNMNIFFTNTGLAGRFFVGYQFARYFALELGYYRFKSFDFKANANAKVGMNTVVKKLTKHNNHYHLVLPFDFTANATMNTYIIDLTAKFILPLKANFSVYAKLGVAYLDANAHIDLHFNIDPFRVGVTADPSVNLVCPEFGVGLDYKISEHFSTDFSWLHVQKYNGNSFPNIDVLAVGLLYHF